MSAEQIKVIDNVSNLPKKDGSLDVARYEGWKPDSLRRALWDRMQAGNCTRCGSKDHLRSKCPHKEKGWEKDFNKGASFFDYKPPSAQSRAQWTPFGQGGHTLCVECDSGFIGVDTMSDIGTADRRILRDVRPALGGITVDHVGGQTVFEERGELDIHCKGEILTVSMVAVTRDHFPPEICAILGSPARLPGSIWG